MDLAWHRDSSGHIQRNKTSNFESKNVKFYGYEEYPLKALNEFRKMNDFVYKRLKMVKCPLLYIHSNSDRVSLSKNI